MMQTVAPYAVGIPASIMQMSSQHRYMSSESSPVIRVDPANLSVVGYNGAASGKGAVSSVSVEVWNHNQVMEWIMHNNFGEDVEHAFAQFNVDGQVLNSLTLESLKSELGLSDLRTRARVINAIKALKPDSSGQVAPPMYKEEGLFNFNEPDPVLSTPAKELELWATRKKAVTTAFSHAWDGYVAYAWGHDELNALDTAHIMGNMTVFKKAADWVKGGGLKMNADVNANVFETTIRVIGGLLTSYHLSKDEGLLKEAVKVADKFMPAYEQSQSKATTVQMEMKYLSYLTKDPKYWNAAQEVMRVLDEQDPGFDGLVPIYIQPKNGKFFGQEIRLGSRADSYYEYLGKQYLLTNSTEKGYLRQYNRAINGIKAHLLMRSDPHHYLYIRELPSGLTQPPSEKMDHLVCYLPATLAILATKGKMIPKSKWSTELSLQQQEDLYIAEEITRSCYEMYHQTVTGLAPEIVYWKASEDDSIVNGMKTMLDPFRSNETTTTKGGNVFDKVMRPLDTPDDLVEADFKINPLDGHNLLRPETVESLFVMYRITGERKYREWGWKIFRAFEKWTKVSTGGYTSLNDVRIIPPPPRGKMESFFLGETLKYFYLLFSEPDVIPLDKYVFNTECHPFPIFEMPEEMKEKLVWVDEVKSGNLTTARS
ncbi:hypothetical protein HDU76_005385 [Blyttiomyces sp. JEL0837]|nr:hypothetical protein HDU76_005385 [Blyttiomyces sp. JEL0837]